LLCCAEGPNRDWQLRRRVSRIAGCDDGLLEGFQRGLVARVHKEDFRAVLTVAWMTVITADRIARRTGLLGRLEGGIEGWLES
jgi:hypothetical protein